MNQGEVFLFGVIVITIKLLNSCGFCVPVEGKKQVYQHCITLLFLHHSVYFSIRKVSKRRTERWDWNCGFSALFWRHRFLRRWRTLYLWNQKGPHTGDRPTYCFHLDHCWDCCRYFPLSSSTKLIWWRWRRRNANEWNKSCRKSKLQAEPHVRYW